MAVNLRRSGIWAAGRDKQTDVIVALAKPARFAAAQTSKTLIFR
jgi:hypothetical protein